LMKGKHFFHTGEIYHSYYHTESLNITKKPIYLK
jgi:hypothetical protein